MRSATFNVRSELPRSTPAADMLFVFERMALVRYFEMGVVAAVKDKRLAFNVYLSTGQEAVAAVLSLVARGYQIFGQHRAHDLFLAFGGPPEKLRDELLGLPSGSNEGKAGSNCIHWHDDKMDMYGHNGLIGENVPLACGAALANGRPTLCVFGDGAVEEDYLLAGLGFAATKKLPILFVCVDNDMSILTPTSVRRDWQIVDVARSFGLKAVDLSDDPWTLLAQTREFTAALPALMNVRVCRGHWHVGVGIDGPPEWDRYAMVKATLVELGHQQRVNEIEEQTRTAMEKLWQPSAKP
jgi:TPP-dependent pyruvate/acetoin dehydrogenase alpha subunit